MSTFHDFETHRGSLAVSYHFIISEIRLCHLWNHLIEISCKKLEEPGFPVLLIELGIKYSFVSSILQNVFIDIECEKLLDTTIDPEYLNSLLGGEG